MAQKKTYILFDFIKSFLMPLLVGKTTLLYFGLQYAKYNDPQMGWGIVLSLLFTLSMIARFLYKYRHHDDP